VVGLLVYRLWFVEHSGISLFFDEAQYWDWSKHLAWGYFSKPPLIAGLIWLSTHLFGDSVLGVKMVVMLLYPATALCLVGFARALWPTSSGVRTGMVGGALFMTIPMVALMGMFASTDAPLILCWTLASWALWRAQVTNRMSYWVGLGVVCGVGLMGKYTMAAFALTAIWTLWAVHGPQRGIARLGPWVAVLVTLAVLSPNLIWNAQNGFPTMQHTAELTAQSGRSGGIFPALQFLVGQIAMLGPLAVLAGLWLLRHQPQPVAAAPASIPASQWAASSEMMPPSQWANSMSPSRTGAQLGVLPGLRVKLPLLVGHEPAVASGRGRAGLVCRCPRQLGCAVHGRLHHADCIAPEPAHGAAGIAPPYPLAGGRAAEQCIADLGCFAFARHRRPDPALETRCAGTHAWLARGL